MAEVSKGIADGKVTHEVGRVFDPPVGVELTNMRSFRTIRFHRGKLPHWEVQAGRYFVTFRLADSLPKKAVENLRAFHLEIAAIKAASEAFERLQQRYFRTMEKYLDAGSGACALALPEAANVVIEEMTALQDWHIAVPHYTVMPNHVHALILPGVDCDQPLGEIMKRLKGRTAHRIRQIIPGEGPHWQREWFDRWMRSDEEEDRVVEYIRENPVKARLVSRWQEHAWTK